MRRPIFFIFTFFFLSFAALTVYAASQILVTVSINPLNVDADANGNIQVNKIFTLKARIQNDGRISGKRHKDVRWKLKANKTGEFVASVRVNGAGLDGQNISSEDSVLIHVKKRNIIRNLVK